MITCTFENGTSTTNLRHVVVHAIVEQEGKILLGKRHDSFLEGGKWGLPAGYVDRNETIYQAVLRELYEETGWEGEIISLFRINSHPDRPNEDRQNISIECIVKPLRQTGKPDWETPEIKWEPIDMSYDFSSLAFDHGECIKLYLEHKRQPKLLPLIA